MTDLFQSADDLGEYLFRIIDNGGASEAGEPSPEIAAAVAALEARVEAGESV